MASLDNPEPVNLAQSIFLCNVFTFFFAAGKACLFPFLTIFLKKLGLSATYTGLIIGMKTLVGFIFAPLLAKCAVRCGRRRCMLMFSLFMMALTYLCLTAIPSMDKAAFSSGCSNDYHPGTFNMSHEIPGTGKQGFVPGSVTTTKAPLITSSLSPKTSQINAVTGLPEVNTTQQTIVNNVSTTQTIPQHTKLASTVKTTIKPDEASDEELKEVLKELIIGTGLVAPSYLEGASTKDLLSYIDDMMQTESGRKHIGTALVELPEDKAEKLNELINPARKKRDIFDGFLSFQSLHQFRKREVEENSTGNGDNDEEKTESNWISFRKSMYKKFKKILNDVTETEKNMFVVIMVILMVGEMFCSPVEKIADDSWYEFLESIDDLEKYGMHRVWSSFAFILLPIIVTLSVDNTTCLFGVNVDSFMLHFYLFGAFLGLAFILAFFYPMSTSEKYKYASKVGKGIRIICCSGRGLMFSVTLLIMGIIYSSYYNFLFWRLVDMGSKEITLGLCLTIAALSEIPMLLFNDRLVKKIGNSGVLALSILLLSGRVLYYSFLPTPWAVLPIELLHAFTHTAMWWSVLSSPSFNISPALSRSIRSIFSSIYFGLGFAIGSIVSGVIYENFGSTILFQAGAVMAIAWFPILVCGIRCCREDDRTEVKYTKLLASEDSSDMEDDWLEHALKNK